MNFRISNKAIIVLIGVISVSFYSQAQSIEQIDETVSDITSAIGILRGDISSVFSVSNLFTSSAKDDYRKKLQELNSVKFERTATEPSKWIQKNKITATSLGKEHFWQSGNTRWNRKVSSSDVTNRSLINFAGGKSGDQINKFKSNQLAALNNLTIEDALPCNVRSLILDGLSSEEKSTLNADIKTTPILINFLMEYPETIETYKRLIKTNYRNNLSFLYFWTYDFLTHTSGLNKHEIIDWDGIAFREAGRNRVNVTYNDNELASIRNKEMDILDPILLNYAFPPNYTINYKKLKFRTDNLKRIVSIQVAVSSKDEKKEKIQKSKAFDIKKFNKNLPEKYVFLIPEKINGYKVLQNAFNIDDKKYKLLLKYIEKSYAMAQKTGINNTMNYDFYYDDGDYEPSRVEVQLLSPIETKKLTYGKRIKLDLR